jgi:hypothetical protein
LLHNFLAWWIPVFAGGFWQNGCQTWCFGGEFVVLCVVNVVLSRHFFGLEKYATDSGFILRVSRFGNMVYVSPNAINAVRCVDGIGALMYFDVWALAAPIWRQAPRSLNSGQSSRHTIPHKKPKLNSKSTLLL